MKKFTNPEAAALALAAACSALLALLLSWSMLKRSDLWGWIWFIPLAIAVVLAVIAIKKWMQRNDDAVLIDAERALCHAYRVILDRHGQGSGNALLATARRYLQERPDCSLSEVLARLGEVQSFYEATVQYRR